MTTWELKNFRSSYWTWNILASVDCHNINISIPFGFQKSIFENQFCFLQKSVRNQAWQNINHQNNNNSLCKVRLFRRFSRLQLGIDKLRTSMDRVLDLKTRDISSCSCLYTEAWPVLYFLVLVVTKINKNSLVFPNYVWSMHVKVRTLNGIKCITPGIDCASNGLKYPSWIQ